jgi:hypothetical protein
MKIAGLGKGRMLFWFKFIKRVLCGPDPISELFRASIQSGVPYEVLTASLRDEKGSLEPWIENQYRQHPERWRDSLEQLYYEKSVSTRSQNVADASRTDPNVKGS